MSSNSAHALLFPDGELRFVTRRRHARNCEQIFRHIRAKQTHGASNLNKGVNKKQTSIYLHASSTQICAHSVNIKINVLF